MSVTPPAVSHSLPLAVNCSIVFGDLPVLERAAAARRAGFDAVEFWWPWGTVAAPTMPEVDRFVASIDAAGVDLIALNFFAGDLAGTDAGVVSTPGRAGEFHASVDIAVLIARRLGTRLFNALYGNTIDDADPDAQRDQADANLAYATDAMAAVEGTVLIEPLSGPKPYPLRTAADALAVVDRAVAAGHPNVGFLCDLFHLASNGDDVDRVVNELAGRVTHVQIADAPGRNEPGTGQLPLDDWLAGLEAGGYAGWVGLEYKPADAADPFAWVPATRRPSRRSGTGD